MHTNTEMMDDLLATLAASFTPTTLAAVRADLLICSQRDDRRQALAAHAAAMFAKQHAALVGDDVAEIQVQDQLPRLLRDE